MLSLLRQTFNNYKLIHYFMKKEIVYFKVRIDGADISSSYIMNRACFQSLDDAVQYVKDGWNQYAKDLFLAPDRRRKVLNDYERLDSRGYFHQMVFISDTSFVQVVTIAVDKCFLILR